MATKAYQYTIRSISPRLDRALKKVAADRGMSLNTLIVGVLEAELGISAEPRAHHDLDDLFGTWIVDKAVDRALAEQRRVEEKDWK